MMYQVHLDELVPQNNFYRLLDRELDLHFLYLQSEKIHEIHPSNSNSQDDSHAHSR